MKECFVIGVDSSSLSPHFAIVRPRPSKPCYCVRIACGLRPVARWDEQWELSRNYLMMNRMSCLMMPSDRYRMIFVGKGKAGNPDRSLGRAA
jgi:hypothetical protein